MSALTQFSPHLFWDCGRDVDVQQHKTWLCQRVLEYGELSDWHALLALYGKDGIRESVLEMRTLRDKPRSFVCCVLEIDQTTLRCYKNKQSQTPSWPY